MLRACITASFASVILNLVNLDLSTKITRRRQREREGVNEGMRARVCDSVVNGVCLTVKITRLNFTVEFCACEIF